MAILLSELRLGAQDLCDYVNNPAVANATWTRWANQAIDKLWRRLAQLYPAPFQASASFTLAGGVGGNTWPRPANLRRLLHIAKDPTIPGQRRAIRGYNLGEKEDQSGIRAAIEGANVVFERFDVCAGNYAAYYTLGPTVLVADGDAIDAILEPGVEYVELCMAIRALDKEESSSAALRADRDALEEEFPIQFASLGSSEPTTIVDVNRTGPSRYWWQR